LAFERGVADGAEAIQIFTKSSRQWAARDLTEADVSAFRAAHQESGLSVIVHDSYLINLGAEAGEVRSRSIEAFRDELVRCTRLGVSWLVAHPGANADEAAGLRLIADGVREGLDATAGSTSGVLLEITAGQGIALGYRFEHLQELLRLIGRPARVGICLDTCHLYAAGYDIATDEGYSRTMADLERTVGAAQVRAIHMNDAKKGLGCRVDRHERIGEGTLGVATFERFVRDPRFRETVAVIETPEGRWQQEVALLQSLRDETSGRKQTASRRASATPARSKAKPAVQPKPRRRALVTSAAALRAGRRATGRRRSS
jgi:deoxyribonuclease-4